MRCKEAAIDIAASGELIIVYNSPPITHLFNSQAQRGIVSSELDA